MIGLDSEAIVKCSLEPQGKYDIVIFLYLSNNKKKYKK